MSLSRRQFSAPFTFAAAMSLLTPLRAAALVVDSDADPDTPQNVFISPCGEPFRAKLSDPYPVANWFKQVDKNADGKIDHAEFMADTEAFFKKLDLNGDGVLSNYEVAVYEHYVAPEVLGYRIKVGRNDGARLWRAQIGGGGLGGGGGIDPGGSAASEAQPKKPTADESRDGAAPFSLLVSPEPVAAADLDFSGIIRKANFLRLADMHFTTLDRDGVGYLTLASLPKTAAQRQVEKYQRKHGKRS